jgi:D-psicose/D-tagatose/L-ribulose 3-epimerase
MAEELGVTLNVEIINRFEQFLINDCTEALACARDQQSRLPCPARYLPHEYRGGLLRRCNTESRQVCFAGPLVMEPFVMRGGQVGWDIVVWREMIPNPDLAAASAGFVKRNLC